MKNPWKQARISPLVPPRCEFYGSQADMPRGAIALMDHYAYEHGESYDSYLATESDRAYFWSPGRRGVIGFVRWGRTLNVLGGLLAPPADQQELLTSFLDFANLNKLTVNFAMVAPPLAKVFRRHGFRVSKCGEELFVRLQRVEWQGKNYQWLRRQENACLRQELYVEEIDPQDNPRRYREIVVPQLDEVNAEHLAGTLHGRELVFYEGRFTPWDLRRRRLFVTWQGDRIVAFVVCNPALSGDLWAVEIYRRRATAPPGVMPFSILQIMRQLKDEGVPFASLSSVPFLRCGAPVSGDDIRLQGSCQFFWNCMNWLFDVRGIYHFKSRFRPTYREMYLATYPRSSLTSLVSLLAVWQLHRVSPWRLGRHLVRYWRDRSKRSQLAQPEYRPERKLRDLRRLRRPAQANTAEPQLPVLGQGLSPTAIDVPSSSISAPGYEFSEA